ncbi:SusC/RagA family TonB-linked outer membrane protein [Chryseobacterium antibioticum]|uniref:SusC/RagA family TonB-linked outer membrane protein n=2 Tax=Chryseobacterium TaxID=59732 RepID=A0A7Y0ALA1_9FLAO|nr:MULTISPECIES: SusC/RagA family TonB-linked outer membrane protein [Chryseobacterium]MCT2407889.1 SusC/RagA family TonB-linked outer membrane protein [Chryseobacterium pyrolae]NML69400.1 SusC/RagA family TonB-linked outer membrane protein [Chryseobacterium antibioticum]
MNVKLRVLSAGALFFLGQVAFAQKTKKDTASTTQIEEVVMVGFGQKKTVQEITGSASTMTAKSIEDLPVASVDKMLQGRVTGVQTGSASGQPGGFANVRVRGISSINGVTSPIYIVDGVRVANGSLGTANGTSSLTNILANLSPDDVESITVLKDAVSTAVYGADAGAGVIVITTKSGKKGKPRFNLSFNSGFNQQAVDMARNYSAGEYKTYLRDMYNNSLNSNYSIEQMAGGSLNGLISASSNAQVMSIMSSPYDTNWLDIVRKDGYQQNADFSMSGGNDKFTYYAAANMFDQNSIIRNSFFKRLSYTTKLSYQATDKLKVSTDFQISHSKTRTLSDGGAFSNPMLAQYFNRPTDPARNADGSWYLGNPANSRLSNNQFNPGYLLDNNYIQAGTFRAFANLNVEYKILKNLTYRFVFSPEYVNVEEDTYWNPLHGDGYTYGGYQRTSANRYFNFNVQNILDYSQKFGKHNIGASLIQEAYKTNRRFLMATGITVGTPELETLRNFVVPYGYDGTQTVTSRYGYAATGHYDYDKLILLDASYRRDVLSQFTPGSKAGNFWSVGAGFDLARLDFVKDMNSISMAKFRASYGKLGNQVTANPYALYAYDINYNDYAGARYYNIYNPNLSWETVNPFNVGLDLGFLRNRITVTAEYYNKKTNDLIYNVPLSPSQGGILNDNGTIRYGVMLDNVGTLVNQGFEFNVNADIFKGDRNQVNWSIGANLSTLKNEVTELYGGTVNTGTTTLRVGEGARTFYLRKWAGVDSSNGDPLWYLNGVDGETTNDYNKAQQAVQGSFLAKVFGGANTSISYKGFALDLQFTYGFGGKIYDDWASYTYSDGQYSLNYPGYGDVMGDYWTPQNTGASNPKPMAGGNKLSNRASTRFLYDADYIRLSNARFGYTFTGDFLKGSGLNSLQVYVMANNAWTHRFDDRLKFDPETNISGYTNLSLPILKSYLFGVNISF